MTVPDGAVRVAGERLIASYEHGDDEDLADLGGSVDRQLLQLFLYRLAGSVLEAVAADPTARQAFVAECDRRTQEEHRARVP